MSTINERVQAGIALLDEKGPADWRERIDLGKLDLAYMSRCILGQVFGDFYAGARDLGFKEEWAWYVNERDTAPYGFWRDASLPDAYGDEDLQESEDEYAQLTAAWKAALA